MNGTVLENADTIVDEVDWALAGIPNGVNATGLLSDDLEEYGGLTEVQTLILACVATVIPLFLGLLLVLGVRMVWKKYKNHNTDGGYDNDGLRREDSCDGVKSSSFMQSAEELKASESQYSVLMPDDVACCYAADAAPLPPLLYNSPPNNRFGDTHKTNLNGSIITLTMKNNHLIVETEERVPGICVAESAAEGGDVDKSVDYEYDDDEFDMEAEMLRREFREASLLANGSDCAAAAAVLEPSTQTQVDLTADRRPTAAVSVQSYQLQQPAADHSSGGSSSADSRAAETAYAYGNQSEYKAEDGAANKHKGGGGGHAVVIRGKSTPSSVGVSNNNNNNDDEYLVEQRLLGNGVDGVNVITNGTAAVATANAVESSSPLPTPNGDDVKNCSPDGAVAATVATVATAAQ